MGRGTEAGGGGAGRWTGLREPVRGEGTRWGGWQGSWIGLEGEGDGGVKRVFTDASPPLPLGSGDT